MPETITLAEARPGIFTINQQGTGQGAILDAQGQLVDSASPASAGEVVQVFCTGLGATNPQVASGEPGPAAEPLARVVVPVEARVGGRARVADEPPAATGEERRALGETCPLLLADVGGEPSDAASVRSDGRTD